MFMVGSLFIKLSYLKSLMCFIHIVYQNRMY